MPPRPDATEVDTAMAASVRGLAAARQISSSTLAGVCGLGTTQFSAKLNGRSPWKLREAAALAAYFGVTLDDLVHGQVPLTARTDPTGRNSG